MCRFDFSCSFDFTRTHRLSAALVPIQAAVSSTAPGQNHRLESPTNTRVADQRILLRRSVPLQFRLQRTPACSATAHIATWRSILHRSSTTNTHTHRSSAELFLQSTRVMHVGTFRRVLVVYKNSVPPDWYVAGYFCIGSVCRKLEVMLGQDRSLDSRILLALT